MVRRLHAGSSEGCCKSSSPSPLRPSTILRLLSLTASRSCGEGPSIMTTSAVWPSGVLCALRGGPRAPGWVGSEPPVLQRRGRDVATSKRVISTFRGTGLESTARAGFFCWARCCCRWSIDSHRSDRTARSGSRGSAAITYSRHPSSCRDDRIASTLVSTNRSRSFGSTENTPCTITMAIRLSRRSESG